MAIRRIVGLSLWKPEVREGWEQVAALPLAQLALPQKLWVIGLGHLGQAYLRTLFTLPYAEPDRMTVLLQDTDALTPANWSTQLLTRLSNVGAKKTRCMAGLCEVRGFRTVIVERPFGAPFRLGPEDPRVALCGVDNLTARRELDSPGFTRVIEAGLGHEGEEHLDFQLHGFPGSRTPGDVWGPEQAPFAEGLLELPAYRHLRNGGADECGLTQVAGLAVGVPFVGAFVSSLVVAETVRAVAMQHTYEVMDGTLWSLHHLRAARCRTQMQENVGFLEAKAERSRRRRMGSGAQAADADLP